MVERLSRKAGSSQKVLPEARSGREALLEGQNPSRMAGSIQEAHPETREWSGGFLGSGWVVLKEGW